MITFEYPIFLWGMLVLLGPLVLHLFNWRRPQERLFPSIQFLERGQLRQEGRHSLQDILVLLLRMLLIALVVLMLAHPEYTSPENGNTAEKRVFVVDCSASISGWNCRERTEKLLKKHFCRGDSIIFSSDSVLKKTDAPADLPISFAEGEHASAMASALEELKAGGTLFIISDFKKNDWRKVPHCIPANVMLQLLDCGQNENRNVGISSVRSMPLAKQRVRVIAVVENYSDTEEKRQLRVSVGSQLQQSAVNLPPNSSRHIAFSFDVQDDRVASGTAFLDKDEYELDDRYYFALGGRRMPKALVIGGEESIYVAHALSGAFDVAMSEPIAVMEENFADKQVVFVSGDEVDLSQVPESIPLLIAGGENRSLRSLRQNGRLNAQNCGKVVSTPAHSLGIGKICDRKLSMLFGTEADLFNYRIPAYLRLKVVDNETSVLMESLDGEPLLLRLGNCCFFAFPFENFVLCNSFLPLLRELIYLPDDFCIKRIEGKKPGIYDDNGMIVEANAPHAESKIEKIELDDVSAMLKLPEISGDIASHRVDFLPYLGMALMLVVFSLLIMRRQK